VLKRGEKRVLLGLGAITFGVQQGVHHEINATRTPGLGNPTLFEPAPAAPYLVSHASPVNYVYGENGEVIGFIDENGNFVPLTDDETNASAK